MSCTTQPALGFELSASEYHPQRSVIGEVKSTIAGNVTISVGRENARGWYQTEYVVLTVDEARELVSRLHGGIDGEL
jgi:hypothetical protein